MLGLLSAGELMWLAEQAGKELGLDQAECRELVWDPEWVAALMDRVEANVWLLAEVGY